MKRICALLLCLFLLTGCNGQSKEMDRAMALRRKLLSAQGCSFEAEITADYGDKLHTFAMSCQADAQGNLTFSVTEPETVAGIAGSIGGEGGKLTFDGTVLHFELLTDDQISPISAPWILLKTLRGGYLTSACQEDQLLRLTIDDSYDEDALKLDIWLDGQDKPVRADILFRERRILSLNLTKFEILSL